MAEGVGVNGGGLGSSFLATFRRLLSGVVGGGGMCRESSSAWDGLSSCDAVVAMSSDALLWRLRFFGGAAFSAILPLLTTSSDAGFVRARVERLNDIVIDLTGCSPDILCCLGSSSEGLINLYSRTWQIVAQDASFRFLLGLYFY